MSFLTYFIYLTISLFIYGLIIFLVYLFIIRRNHNPSIIAEKELEKFFESYNANEIDNQSFLKKVR